MKLLNLIKVRQSPFESRIEQAVLTSLQCFYLIIRYGMMTDMKICSDCKLISLLFFRVVHADSRSCVSNGLYLWLECLISVMIWHSFGILKDYLQKSLFTSAYQQMECWVLLFKKTRKQNRNVLFGGKLD